VLPSYTSRAPASGSVQHSLRVRQTDSNSGYDETMFLRQAKAEDLNDASRIMQQAVNDLREHHGLVGNRPLPLMQFPGFCLAEDPAGVWIAEEDEAVIGFGVGWASQALWFLSELFVKPGVQAKGVGQALLSKVLEQAERCGAEHRALITFAYNTRSIGLYIANGFYPRQPLYRVSSLLSVLEQLMEPSISSEYGIEPLVTFEAWVGAIDQDVLNFRRDAHHRFLLGDAAMCAVQIKHKGKPAGYAYISSAGQVGPVCIAPDHDAAAAIQIIIRYAIARRPQRISMIVPGAADRVLAALLVIGFRLDEPLVLMSAQPFGDWCHYFPRDPNYM